jgi:hypothetical protein
MIADVVTVQCIAIVLEIICPYLVSLLFPVSPHLPCPCKKIRKHIFAITYHRSDRGVKKVEEREF